MSEETEARTRRPVRPARPPRPPVFKVRLANPDDYATPGKVVFSSDTEGIARNYIKQHHPRGREVYLETPAGRLEHYSAEHDMQGHEDGGWFDYDEDEDA